jgi:hypothetical protein
MFIEANSSKADEQFSEHESKELVKVTVDNHPHKVRRGVHIVSNFKREVGVPPDKELDLVEHGEFKPLGDNDEIKIKEGMVFVSHTRTGSSS